MQSSESLPVKRTPVSTVTGEEVQVLILKLDRARPYLLRELPLIDLSSSSSSSSSSSLQSKERLHRPPKHWKQCESICQHLQQFCQLSSNQPCTFVELGCGTAQLSEHINQIYQGRASHVLIDRLEPASFKAERLRDGSIFQRQKLAQSNAGTATQPFTLERQTADLQDTSLIGQILLKEKKQSKDCNILAVSKHLCGSAADYAIQGLVQCHQQQQSTTITNVDTQLPPLVIATCCHHRCSADSFCNHEFFRYLGFTERDWQVLCIVSGWSSIRVPSTEKLDETTANEPQQYAHLPDLPVTPLPIDLDPTLLANTIPSQEFEQTFSRQAKAELGKRCKLALDTARGWALQRRAGYSCVRLVRYTTLSLEDTLILAQ